jgi:hypothetical protein
MGLEKVIKRIICNKGFYNSFPIGSHTRDCHILYYKDKTQIKIPLHEIVESKPVITYNKEYMKIEWIIPNLRQQD